MGFARNVILFCSNANARDINVALTVITTMENKTYFLVMHLNDNPTQRPDSTHKSQNTKEAKIHVHQKKRGKYISEFTVPLSGIMFHSLVFIPGYRHCN